MIRANEINLFLGFEFDLIIISPNILPRGWTISNSTQHAHVQANFWHIIVNSLQSL